VLVVVLLAAVALAGFLALTLTGPNDREADLLAERLDVRSGMTLGEIGAGSGWLSVAMAGRVGPSGRVYATELGDDQLAEIRAAAREAGAANVTVLRAGEQSTNLAAACCDAIFMRRVYHHLSQPASIVTDIRRALKPGGRLVVIEFESSGVIGTITREGIDRSDLVAQVAQAGFTPVTVEDWPGWDHYVAIFRSPGT
jgi:precorrin-6B methylase 2